jgi:hypothetical protein
LPNVGSLLPSQLHQSSPFLLNLKLKGRLVFPLLSPPLNQRGAFSVLILALLSFAGHLIHTLGEAE